MTDGTPDGATDVETDGRTDGRTDDTTDETRIDLGSDCGTDSDMGDDTVREDGVIEEGVRIVGATMSNEAEEGDTAVGVIELGFVVVSSSGDCIMVEGVSGNDGPLNETKLMGEDRACTVVGVKDDTDDVSAKLTVSSIEGSEMEGADARSRSGTIVDKVHRVKGVEGVSVAGMLG